jgi:hypothetical protein
VQDKLTSHDELLATIKAHLCELETLLAEVNDHWCYEDGVYRFYHQSFKVFYLQEYTLKIVENLQALAPERPLNSMFMQIVTDGTGKCFEREHNQRWLEVTRPIVEAFLHAKYFLEMAVKYGCELEGAPTMVASGWASVLYLYGLR